MNGVEVEGMDTPYASALESGRIRAVETGGCPHAAIREDISCNLTAGMSPLVHPGVRRLFTQHVFARLKGLTEVNACFYTVFDWW